MVLPLAVLEGCSIEVEACSTRTIASRSSELARLQQLRNDLRCRM